MNFGKTFAIKRKDVGLSQKEAAKKLGISPFQLCNYEKGRNEPGIETLLKMSELYDTSLDSLLGVNTVSRKKKHQSPSFEELLLLINEMPANKQEKACDIAKTIVKKL